MKLIDILTDNSILSSKSEARRAILNKGIKINNILVEDNKLTLGNKDFKEKKLKFLTEKKTLYN